VKEIKELKRGKTKKGGIWIICKVVDMDNVSHNAPAKRGLDGCEQP
jgi:hypothetical protein